MIPLFHPSTKDQINSFLANPSHAVSVLGEAGAGKGFTTQHIASALLDCPIEKLSAWPYLKQLACSEGAVGIEQIREIQQFLTLAVPGERPIRRILILENIEALGREAQNALLKTLEETPRDSVIISTIARRDYVLPTIHSRMQQISLLPLPIESASEYFAGTHEAKDIEKAYFISGGLMGLMSAILSSKEDHPLVVAINQARQTLGQSRYERLLSVDSLTKSKEISNEVFLDGLYKLLRASYKQGALKGKQTDELARSLRRLHLVEEAASDLENKVSAKLVLSRLLFSL